MRLHAILSVLAALPAAWAVTIAEINGDKFLSPLKDTAVTGVKGLVLARGPSGIWIRSTEPDDKPETSDAVYVYGKVDAAVKVGDIISLDGKIMEYRSAADYIYLTELSSPANVAVLSSGNTVTPLVIGHDTTPPPTTQYSSLDGGDVFAVPGGVSSISVVNPVLQPTEYGLDFWESLSGELVTVRLPRAISRPNNYGDTWVVGDWSVTGRDAHGGITMTDKDANPEAIIIGSPLDGTSNPKTIKVGDEIAEITGVVTYAFGFYRILPLTALKITKAADPTFPEPNIKSRGNCTGILAASYNVLNLQPASPHLLGIVDHIGTYLNLPDILFLQEIQDGTGPKNDGVVSANATLQALVDGLRTTFGVEYKYISIDPVNNQDGGEPGGNIQVAYLYRPDVLVLDGENPGSPTDANEVLPGPTLKFNPGRIAPADPAWLDSRKPLAAKWKTVSGPKRTLFTVNAHFASKGGSTSIQGDKRPPINGGVEQRIQQGEVAGDFIGQILAQDPRAAVFVAGDFNEFAFVEPLRTFVSHSGLLDLDEALAVPPTDRYSYLFDMNLQQLDHMFASPGILSKAVIKHLHVSTWADSASVVSDHDPSVALLNLCTC